jgi:hypothetical protein
MTLRERQRRSWRNVKWSTKPRRGGAPTAIKIKTAAGDVTYDTRQDVEEQAARKLTDRFKLARDAPISSGQLFDDIGYLGDTTSTRAILEGTYEFPPEMDPHTCLLLEEAHCIIFRGLSIFLVACGQVHSVQLLKHPLRTL